MNINLLGRFFAALAMGAGLGGYIHFDYVKWGQRGREAFLAHQAQRFDLYFVAPRPTIVTVFAATVMMFGALAFYEGLALVVAKVLKSMSDSGPVQMRFDRFRARATFGVLEHLMGIRDGS